MAHRRQPALYVALDVEGADAALALAEQLDPVDCGLKIGKELFTRAGPQLVRRFVDDGYRVFLDLKYHDIPNTVAGACRAAADLGVQLVNVHASGGSAMLRAARAAIEPGPDAPALIAVTVLTSMSQQDLAETGVSRTVEEQVQALAGLTRDAGLDGVVCSAWEASAMRDVFRQDDPVIVTPGIRPAGASVDDQSRIMTPAAAIGAGATSIVVGRPIARADNPWSAAAAIADELRSTTYDG